VESRVRRMIRRRVMRKRIRMRVIMRRSNQAAVEGEDKDEDEEDEYNSIQFNSNIQFKQTFNKDDDNEGEQREEDKN